MTSTVTSFVPNQRVRTRRAHPLSYLRFHALELLILLEFACQLLLLSGEIGQLRQLVRIALFGTSIAMLLLLSGRGEAHPSAAPAKVALAIVILSLFHPNTNTLLAGSASLAMYLAILAPLFWVRRLQIDTPDLRRLLMIVWIFQTASAAVGILQVYFPGHLEPALSTVVANMSTEYLKSLQFRNALGEITWRAMGLTDMPGGAATAGFYAALFGTAFMLASRSPFARVFSFATIVIGLVAIYLSQVRSTLILLAVGELGVTGLIGVRRSLLSIRPKWRRQEAGNIPRLVGAMAIAAVLSFSWAVAVGGTAIATRFSTLVADKPAAVYMKNRGHFIEGTIDNFMLEYPLGAGLGRWGMMNYYFGDNSDPDTSGFWVEEQWTGWIADGGFPLVLVYLFAILVAIRAALRIVLRPVEPELAIFGAVICAYDLGALVSCFGYPYFSGQGGLEFWLLNAALFAAYLGFRKRTALPDNRR